MKLTDLLDVMDSQDELCLHIYSKNCSDQQINTLQSNVELRKTVECWKALIRLNDVPNYKILYLWWFDQETPSVKCRCE